MPEGNTFKKERLPPRELGPRGQAVGAILADGPSPTGEATVTFDGAVKQALQEDSQQVEKEPLPVEHRKHVERFYDILLQGE